MKRLCAWCGKNMGEKKPLNDNSNTYGICVHCMLKYFGFGDGNRVSGHSNKNVMK